jgi:DNA-binding CsgD family transcriptional regulator
MESRILIIHPSEIVRQGLYTILKRLFNIDSTLLSGIDELKSYMEIKESKLVLLIDSALKAQADSTTLKTFDNSNALLTVLVRPTGEKTSCTADCDCCFFLEDDNSRIYSLLHPFLESGTEVSFRKNGAGLTDREVDVIKLVAYGRTNKDIAEELCISIHTVISHRKNITEKLGIKSISGLTVYAMLNNLIDANSIDPDNLI